jgi:hypothetical protein
LKVVLILEREGTVTEIQKGRTRRALGLAFLAGLTAACVTGQAGTTPAQAQSALHILARYDLPPGNSTPTDVRWASDDSVFVSRADEGVFEIALKDGKTAKRRQPLPDRDQLRPFGTFDRVAVSQHDLIASSLGFSIAWRPIQLQTSGRVDIETRVLGTFADIDAQGDRLALLGLPHNDLDERFSSNPGVLWVGSLSKGLGDFRALLRDASGSDPFKSSLLRCYPLDTGSVRFLADGSLLAVPGFQPGAYLYDADGHGLHVWTNEDLGIDSGCEGVTQEQNKSFFDSPEVRRAWYDRHRIVDDILPLPQGPGLLVRWAGRDGNPRWILKVLQPQGITLYRVPFSGRTPYERLRGDVRQGKIVFLRTLDSLTASARTETRGEILVAELPVGPAGEAK